MLAQEIPHESPFQIGATPILMLLLAVLTARGVIPTLAGAPSERRVLNVIDVEPWGSFLVSAIAETNIGDETSNFL